MTALFTCVNEPTKEAKHKMDSIRKSSSFFHLQRGVPYISVIASFPSRHLATPVPWEAKATEQGQMRALVCAGLAPPEITQSTPGHKDRAADTHHLRKETIPLLRGQRKATRWEQLSVTVCQGWSTALQPSVTSVLCWEHSSLKKHWRAIYLWSIRNSCQRLKVLKKCLTVHWVGRILAQTTGKKHQQWKSTRFILIYQITSSESLLLNCSSTEEQMCRLQWLIKLKASPWGNWNFSIKG